MASEEGGLGVWKATSSPYTPKIFLDFNVVKAIGRKRPHLSLTLPGVIITRDESQSRSAVSRPLYSRCDHPGDHPLLLRRVVFGQPGRKTGFFTNLHPYALPDAHRDGHIYDHTFHDAFSNPDTNFNTNPYAYRHGDGYPYRNRTAHFYGNGDPHAHSAAIRHGHPAAQQYTPSNQHLAPAHRYTCAAQQHSYGYTAADRDKYTCANANRYDHPHRNHYACAAGAQLKETPAASPDSIVSKNPDPYDRLASVS